MTSILSKIKDHKIQWLPILLIALNIYDIYIHVVTDQVEPVRVSGNIVAMVAALIALLGIAKSVAHQILGGSAAAVFILNTYQSFQHGFGTFMIVSVGGTLFMLLRLWHMKSMEVVLQSENSGVEFYHRWWTALLISLFGVAIVVVAG